MFGVHVRARHWGALRTRYLGVSARVQAALEAAAEAASERVEEATLPTDLAIVQLLVGGGFLWRARERGVCILSTG